MRSDEEGAVRLATVLVYFAIRDPAVQGLHAYICGRQRYAKNVLKLLVRRLKYNGKALLRFNLATKEYLPRIVRPVLKMNPLIHTINTFLCRELVYADLRYLRCGPHALNRLALVDAHDCL